MIKSTYFLFLSVVLIFSCNSYDEKKIPDTRLPEPDLIDRLRSQKALIDTLYKHNQKNLISLIKQENNDTIIQQLNDEEYDNIEVSYTILKDSSDKIVTASEFPFSQSGDWHIIVTHYFDSNGNTFAVERQTNFFNSGCTEGVAYETITRYYDTDFKNVDSLYRLVDEKDKSLKKDSCQFFYNYDHKVSKNVKQYLEANKIANIPALSELNKTR